MALNSKVKRMAVAGAGRPFMRAVDANSMDASQRSSVALSYPVTAFGPPVEGPGSGIGPSLIGPLHKRLISSVIKDFGR